MGIQWDRICPELTDTECINTGGTNLKSNLSLFSRFPHVLQHPVVLTHRGLEELPWCPIPSWLWFQTPSSMLRYFCHLRLEMASSQAGNFALSFLQKLRQAIQESRKWNGVTKPLNFLGRQKSDALKMTRYDKDLLVAWLCKVRYTWQRTFLLVDPRWVLGLIHLHQKFHCRWTVNLTASIKGALAFDMFACSGCIRAEHSNTSPMFWLRLNPEESLVSGNGAKPCKTPSWMPNFL